MTGQELIDAIDRLTRAVNRIAESVEAKAGQEREQATATEKVLGPNDPGYWDWVMSPRDSTV